MTNDRKLELNEIGNTYVGARDRFVVSLVVGYEADENIQTPVDALRYALELTRDEGSADTHWYVFDRQTGELHLIEQEQIEPPVGWEEEG
jgi:hypothetical protein